MSIIKPKAKTESIQYRMTIDKNILEDIKHYCEYAEFKTVDEFFEQAATHILMKDKAFKEWKESKTHQAVTA